MNPPSARLPHWRALPVLAGMCVLSLLLNSWQAAAHRSGSLTLLERAVIGLETPLAWPLARLHRWLRASWEPRRARLLAQNRHLRQQAARLRAENNLLVEQLLRAQRLRALERAAVRLPLPYLQAEVIGLGPAGASPLLLLNEGSRAGVRVGQPVAASQGLLGQVWRVSSQACQVLPITDAAAGVSARVLRSRELGIVKGVGEGRCELRYLAADADLRPGDLVVSTGLGGVFPAGLLIGRVHRVSRDLLTAGKTAEVVPAARVSAAEEVVILLSSPPDLPERAQR